MHPPSPNGSFDSYVNEIEAARGDGGPGHAPTDPFPRGKLNDDVCVLKVVDVGQPNEFFRLVLQLPERLTRRNGWTERDDANRGDACGYQFLSEVFADGTPCGPADAVCKFDDLSSVATHQAPNGPTFNGWPGLRTTGTAAGPVHCSVWLGFTGVGDRVAQTDLARRIPLQMSQCERRPHGTRREQQPRCSGLPACVPLDEPKSAPYGLTLSRANPHGKSSALGTHAAGSRPRRCCWGWRGLCVRNVS